MQEPKEYVDVLHQFVELGHKGVKLDANREDWACLRMAAFILELPVEVKIKKGEVFLLRKDNA